MTSRAALVMFAAVLALAGCRKAPASKAILGTGSGPAAQTAPDDYRTLTPGLLEVLIQDKTGSPIKLTAAGPNRYTGTQPSPDKTAEVPVTVTVEEQRVVLESRVGNLTWRRVITPRGLVEDDLRESPGR